jgi:hypothetical protein
VPAAKIITSFRWPFACNPTRMRPLTQNGLKVKSIHEIYAWMRALGRLPFLQVLATGTWLPGCGGGPGTVNSPPPPPPSISVTVAPMSGPVLLGNSQTFTATVTNTTDTRVNWSVNGAPGGSVSSGTINSVGVYTAPADLPSPAIVQVTATSQADSTKSATAQLTVTSDITITLAPPNASVELGATQAFHATITSAGHPGTSVRWSLSGSARPVAWGSVDLSGNYTVPGILPSTATATLTAQSVADPSKQATAPINITSHFTLQVTAPQSVPARGTATIVATMTPLAGSNPSTILAWSLSGPGCSSTTCGTLTIVTTQGSGGTVIADTATYTSPTMVPNPDRVTVTLTPQADVAKKAQATMAVQAGVNVSLSRAADTLAANHRVTLIAQVFRTTNTGVSWSVNGVTDGNTSLGQICVVGSSPCQRVSNGSALQVDYLVPGAIPQPNPVSVAATSAVDATRSATAQITVINHVLVSVQPASVCAGAADGFTMLVEGSGFTASSPGPGSTLLIAGTARTTTCSASTEGSAPVTAADVIVLSNASPAATGMDIVVVDPTTAGVSAQGNDVDLNVAALGMFSVANNSCSLSGNPLPLPRPASGSTTFNICVFAESGLDTSMTFTVTGPDDVTVIAKQPAGLGIIQLTLQVPSSAVPGGRTPFIQNTNLDETAASGALVIQ